MCLCVRVRPRAFVFCQWHTLGATLHSDPAPLDSAPLRLLHGAVVQRLSSRKITCKAFPFVVEEQRVTSYFLLVKKKHAEIQKQAKLSIFPGDFLCGFAPSTFVLLLFSALPTEASWSFSGAVPPADFACLVAGVSCIGSDR